MIREHCGQPVLPNSDNPFYFRVKCAVCKKIFTQRKRQSHKPIQRWTVCSCKHIAQDHDAHGVCEVRTCTCAKYTGHSFTLERVAK